MGIYGVGSPFQDESAPTCQQIAKMQGRELDEAEKNTMEPEWMSEQQKPTPSVLLTPNYQAQCRARVQNDELGKLIKQHAQLLVDNRWEKFVHLLHQQGDLHLDPARAGHHPAY